MCICFLKSFLLVCRCFVCTSISHEARTEVLHATHNIAEPSENPQPKYEKEINLERDNLTSNHFEINLWKRGLPGLGVTQLPGWSVPTNGWPGAGVCGFGEPEPHRSASLPRPAAPRTDAHGTVGPGKVKDVLSILKTEARLQKWIYCKGAFVVGKTSKSKIFSKICQFL